MSRDQDDGFFEDSGPIGYSDEEDNPWTEIDILYPQQSIDRIEEMVHQCMEQEADGNSVYLDVVTSPTF